MKITDFEREDWEDFASINGLSVRAGVPREKIARLVAKELADNALDASESMDSGLVGNDGFYIRDYGAGLDPDKISDLFSIKRPLKSSKIIRLPTRGALGNGLRVVTGAVMATNGKLTVSSRGKTLSLNPQEDGTTKAECLGEWNGKGTRVEVHLGKDAGPIDLEWAIRAQMMASYNKTSSVKIKTSAYWYTSTDLHKLFQAAKGATVYELVKEFDGCTGKAQGIAAEFKGMKASDLQVEDAKVLLERMRTVSKPMKPTRLGYVDTIAIGERPQRSVKMSGIFRISSNEETLEIPYVVEAWARLTKQPSIYMHVNRTPITGDLKLYRDSEHKTSLDLFGCGFSNYFDIGTKKNAQVWMNVITPYIEKTSEGKEPYLKYLSSGIWEAIKRAIKKAAREEKNTRPSSCKISQKDIVRESLIEGIKQASGNGKYRYSQRQLYYVIRPVVKEELNGELSYPNFNTILTDYESEQGDLPGMYRDDRGAIYHPHLHQDIPLGTRTVEEYTRPEWIFNKILYSEKEGFFEILKNDKWPEQHDCALLTSKGYASRAARDLIDLLGDTDEEITFFCIHDADAYGTMIYESLQEATKARPKRRVKVINLGLEPEEAVGMGLEVENVEPLKKGERAVAEYVGYKSKAWLQSHRVELNAMTTPQFLEWLNAKMEEYGTGKLIPPRKILAEELCTSARAQLQDKIRDRILKENDFEEKVEAEYGDMESEIEETVKGLLEHVKKELDKIPTRSWKDPVQSIAAHLIEEI